MDIKSWILLIGTLLIVAVICHGFWTAYKARKNDVRMDIETDLPEGDLDDMVLLSGELPNGGARVTPTVGYDALRVTERVPQFEEDDVAGEHAHLDPEFDALDDALIALDDAVAFAEEGLAQESTDEGNFDAGYQPEQATLDLEMEALEERYAARAAAAQEAPLLTDTTLGAKRELRDQSVVAASSDPLPPKKLIAPELLGQQPRKQFEPPFPEELEAERLAEEQRAAEEAKLQEKARQLEEQAAIKRAREAEYEAKVEAQRLRKQEQEQREARARQEAEARAQARAKAKLAAAEKRAREEAQREPEQLSFGAEPIVEFPESSQSSKNAHSLPPVEELVVLNVIAKTRPFHGGDVLELFLRNGIKFGDMNIFHRIDPVSKTSQYSIASVTEPGFFDLRTMESLEFRGLCLFMQLPCSGQATKVFTDMLTVADKLARQLDAEVCDEQYNRLTRQSTEHYRQRVAEFTRRHMSKRAL